MRGDFSTPVLEFLFALRLSDKNQKVNRSDWGDLRSLERERRGKSDCRKIFLNMSIKIVERDLS